MALLKLAEKHGVSCLEAACGRTLSYYAKAELSKHQKDLTTGIGSS
jgi:hypothetical protein